MAKAYEMEMLFNVSVGFKEINDIMAQMGFNDELQLKDAVTVSIKQVLPDIPGEDYIHKVADIIKETYRTDTLNCTACRFAGYKSIRVISVKDDE